MPDSTPDLWLSAIASIRDDVLTLDLDTPDAREDAMKPSIIRLTLALALSLALVALGAWPAFADGHEAKPDAKPDAKPESKPAAKPGEPIKVLIVDGQNNHGNWPRTTKLMKHVLEETGHFAVDVARTAPKGTDPDFKPDFSRYRAVLTNYNGADWPQATREAFVAYVRAGGGVVVVHAANNAFGNWKEYNEIIGLGGWGGRSEKSGPYIYFKNAQIVRDTAAGKGGSHGKQHPFKITLRDSEHPIVKGLPKEFMHENDELYDRLRGPASNMAVLGTAFADPAQGGTGRDEPMILALEPFPNARVYHTPMGHGDYSQMCVAFITLLQRGTQWAATGQVTIPVPADFPTAVKVSVRPIDIAKLPEPTPVK